MNEAITLALQECVNQIIDCIVKLAPMICNYVLLYVALDFGVNMLIRYLNGAFDEPSKDDLIDYMEATEFYYDREERVVNKWIDTHGIDEVDVPWFVDSDDLDFLDVPDDYDD